MNVLYASFTFERRSTANFEEFKLNHFFIPFFLHRKFLILEAPHRSCIDLLIQVGIPASPFSVTLILITNEGFTFKL
jgi:hypothetical protein